MKNKRNDIGITLIALIVTVIVLIILAGTSIAMLTGQNGILNRAKEAKEKTEIASNNEQRKLAQTEALMNKKATTYKGVIIPEGFAPTKIEGENSIDDGLVITDGKGNEFVWIKVPKTTIVYPTAGLNITDFKDDEYTKIEKDLQTYTKEYRNESSFEDVYYKNDTKGWFENEDEYNKLKKKMLESIYINEGFWVGRYEAGSGTIVMKDDEKNSIPLSQQNMYPYNYVTIIEAKTLAETVDSGNLLSSLMFGIQWDLILAFFHNMNDIDNELLLGNSISFGNYNNNLWSINNLNAKYSKYDLSDFKFCPYKKETTESILLTTGADKSFSIANIYDLAGNVWEWTLEKNLNDEKSIVYRGGSYYDNGVSKPISYRDSMKELGKSVNIGFRVTMY